jgi:hypothetical protein
MPKRTNPKTERFQTRRRRRILPVRKEIMPISFHPRMVVVLFNDFVGLKKNIGGDVQADRASGF